MDFDEIETLVFVGEGSYTMYDEAGKIDFAMEKDGAGYVLKITPSEDCITKSVKIIANDGYVAEDGDTVILGKSPVTVRLKRQNQ